MPRTASLLVLLAVPALAPAHYLWATLDPAARVVAIGLREIPGDEPLPLAARAAKVRAWAASTEPLALKADGPWLKALSSDPVVGASLDYGVLDKRDAGRGLFWLEYYAKAAGSYKASEAKLGLPVELSAAKGPDGRTIVTVWRDGKPAPGADVIVERPVGTNAFEGKTAADGTVTLPASPEPLAVRALVTEDGKGAHDGKAYDLVRRYSTLTVAAPASAKPFSRELHDAFGDNHDVVSHSAFIDTVMANALTKAQLVDHLGQRLLVHEAVDRVLDGAQGVPYGPEQKAVLTLLKGDLGGLEAKPQEPWPLTRAFLDRIAASRAQGPYYALGVFHVYYGGITNGGRDIGAMIADETRFTPTYYLKSDGYMAYLAKLNALPLDAAAKAEAIRGGREAYRYIIAFNNEAAFKAKGG